MAGRVQIECRPDNRVNSSKAASQKLGSGWKIVTFRICLLLTMKIQRQRRMLDSKLSPFVPPLPRWRPEPNWKKPATASKQTRSVRRTVRLCRPPGKGNRSAAARSLVRRVPSPESRPGRRGGSIRSPKAAGSGRQGAGSGWLFWEGGRGGGRSGVGLGTSEGKAKKEARLNKILNKVIRILLQNWEIAL